MVGVWSLETGDLLQRLEGHRQGVTDVKAVSESDGLIASASYDFSVRLWSMGNCDGAGVCLAILKGHRDIVRSLAIRCPGKLERTMILSADFGGFVRVWSLAKTMSCISQHVARSIKTKKRREMAAEQQEDCFDVKRPVSFEYETCEMVEHRSFYPHRTHITSMACDRATFITGSRDKSVCVHTFQNSRLT